MSGDQPVPSGADAQFAAWKNGIEERVRALETAPRTPHMSSRNGETLYLNSNGLPRIRIGDDATTIDETQRVSVYVENPLDPTLPALVFYAGDNLANLSNDTAFQTALSAIVVRQDGTAGHVYYASLYRPDGDEHKLGLVHPVLQYDLQDTRPGALQQLPITSGTFVECWRAYVPMAYADKVECTIGAATDVGTTGEFRAKVNCNSVDYTTAAQTLSSGANVGKGLNWSWMDDNNLIPPLQGVTFSIEARRTGGAGNVYIYANGGMQVGSSVLGAGTVGGWS